jgi:thiol-disulfide isomerase/thioredoxin
VRDARFGAVVVLGAVLGTILVAPALKGQVAKGDRFPDLRQEALALPAGEAAAPAGVLADARGKVLLVDFWASWCAPCKASFPAYARLNARYGSKGLVIVAISVDEDRAAFETFVRRMSPPFAVALDTGHRLVSRVGVPTMPTCYLVDRTGVVRALETGFHGARTEAALGRQIEELLAEEPPPPSAQL